MLIFGMLLAVVWGWAITAGPIMAVFHLSTMKSAASNTRIAWLIGMLLASATTFACAFDLGKSAGLGLFFALLSFLGSYHWHDFVTSISTLGSAERDRE